MTEQEGKDKPEQAASGETDRHESGQLLRRDNQKVGAIPISVPSVFNAYLLLVSTVVGFGVLAFYGAHKTAQEISFYLSIGLLGFIPVALSGYWIFTIRNKRRQAGKESINDRVAGSRFIKLASRYYAVISAVQYIYTFVEIGLAIRKFPQHPRLSLTLITYFTSTGIFTAFQALEIRLRKRNIELQQSIDSVAKLANDTGTIVLDLARRERQSRPNLPKSQQRKRQKRN